MKRFLINLDRSPERLARMEIILTAMDAPFERIAAIDGRLLSSEKIKAITAPKSDAMPWTAQEVGVSLSHMECWKRVASGEDSYGLILEDDLHFSIDAKKYISDGSWIPEGVDLIKLETVGGYVSISLTGENVNGRKLCRLHSSHWGAGAYIISKRLASHLVEDHVVFRDQADVILFKQPNKFFAHQLYPAICAQDLVLNGHLKGSYLASTLEDERIPLRRNRKPRGIPKLLREIRRPVVQARTYFDILGQIAVGRRKTSVPYR